MYGKRIIRCSQVLPNRFGDKRYNRSRDQCKLLERAVQGLVGLRLIAVVFALPEAAAGAADIPVVQLIDICNNRVNRLRKVVIVQRRRYIKHKLFSYGENPAVKRIVQLFHKGSDVRIRAVEFRMGRRRNTVDVRIRHVEAVAVPQRNQNTFQNIAHTVIGVFQILRLNHV